MVWTKKVRRESPVNLPTWEHCLRAGAGYGSKWKDQNGRVWTLQYDERVLGAYWDSKGDQIKVVHE